MRWAIFCLIILLAVTSVANAMLVDQIAVDKGDVVKITQKVNNTPTVYKVYVMDIDDEGLMHLRITKNDEYLSSPILSEGDSYAFGKVKITYVMISDIPFLKIYGEPNVQYNVTKITQNVESEENAKPSVNVTVVPCPLVAGKKFMILVEGLRSGRIVMFDPNGWSFSKTFRDSDIITGELPSNVGGEVALKILDPMGRTVLSKVLEVKLSYYGEISATIVPQRPVRGGGLVVMLSEPISGTAILIDSYTGYSNTTTVANGIAIFRIPEDFGGPLILRVMDSNGRTVYQTILQLASGEASSVAIGKLVLTLDKTTVNVGQPVTATVSLGGKPVDAKIYVEDDLGNVVNTYVTTNGRATIKFDSEGTYTVYAKYGRMISNKITVKVNPKPLQISLQTATPEPGKPVTLRITEGATYFITGPGITTPITGTSYGTVTFTPPDEGVYTVRAVYDDQEKSITVNVQKKYTIDVRPAPTWFGKVLNIFVEDSQGNPASGEVKVRTPDGRMIIKFLDNGFASVPADVPGMYVIQFKQFSRSVNVTNVSNSGGIVILAIILGGVIVFAIMYKKNMFDLKTKILKMTKKVDVLE